MFSFKVDKKIRFGRSLSATKCYRIKLGPGTYQLFLLPGMKRACTHIRLCIQPQSKKIHIWIFKIFFFISWKHFFFALCWCFYLRISFILLLIKWSDHFWLSQLQFYLGVYVTALIALLTYPVSTYTAAEPSFSGMKRLLTPLRRTMTDERLSSLEIPHMSTRT